MIASKLKDWKIGIGYGAYFAELRGLGAGAFGLDDHSPRIQVAAHLIRDLLAASGAEPSSGIAERVKLQVVEPIGWRAALQFYAERSHFALAKDDAWDTVSGEPQNFWCDDAGTATVEDGTVAAMALRGTPLPDEDEPAAGPSKSEQVARVDRVNRTLALELLLHSLVGKIDPALDSGDLFADARAAAAAVDTLSNDARRYAAFFQAGLPISFMGESFSDKASLDAAIDALKLQRLAA